MRALRSHPLFREVTDSTLEALGGSAHAKTVEAGHVILSEGDEDLSFFVLLRGSVKVFYRSPDGDEVVVKIFGAPAAFGEMECLSNIPYLETVEAMETSELVQIRRAAFLSALRSSNELCFAVLTDVAARLCIAADNERSLAFSPVEKRLATLLATYGEMYGEPRDGAAVEIRIPLSQDHLAHALGVARRSVTRGLRDLTQQGLIAKRGAHYVILDPEGLDAEAELDLLRIGYRIGEPLRRGR